VSEKTPEELVKDPDFWTRKGKDGRTTNVSPARQQFIRNLTNPESETFSNGKLSYMKAYPNANEETALRASGLIRRDPQMKSIIQQMFDYYHFGQEDRASMAADIGKGIATYTETIVDAKGHEHTVTKYPTFNDRLRAMDMANKMDGSYARAQAETDLAKEEAKKLMRQVEKELEEKMRDVT
jgi:hypothetical protein